MNFHSDEWIMEEVKKHYEEALTIFPKERILGIFYQGSGNYGLDYCYSDVDTKCIVLPSIEDICFNKQPVSYTHIRANNEHIDFKDLRKYAGDFKKQNINFLEILFTKYSIVNEDYLGFWKILTSFNEEIANYDNHRFAKAVAGMSMEKKVALTLDRPSQHDEIVKYGWSTKQLHHLIRLNRFLKRWVDGESFSNCLIDPSPEELGCLKQYGHVIKTYDQAVAIAKEVDEETNLLKEEYIKNNPHIIREDTGEMIDNIVANIIKKSLKKQLEEEVVKKIVCSKCGASTNDEFEISLMELGELDPRCPVCGKEYGLTLEENNDTNANNN